MIRIYKLPIETQEVCFYPSKGWRLDVKINNKWEFYNTFIRVENLKNPKIILKIKFIKLFVIVNFNPQ